MILPRNGLLLHPKQRSVGNFGDFALYLGGRHEYVGNIKGRKRELLAGF